MPRNRICGRHLNENAVNCEEEDENDMIHDILQSWIQAISSKLTGDATHSTFSFCLSNNSDNKLA